MKKKQENGKPPAAHTCFHSDCLYFFLCLPLIAFCLLRSISLLLHLHAVMWPSLTAMFICFNFCLQKGHHLCSSVLVTYFYVTNYSRMYWFKAKTFMISLILWRQKASWMFLPLGSHARLQSRCQLGCSLIQRLN